MEKKYLFGEDSGLLVFSKYKIDFIYEEKLSGACMLDAFANKSSLFFKIKDIIFCNVHIQSNEWSPNNNVSIEQIDRIKDKYEDLIIVGDLNNGNTYDFIKTNNINKDITHYGENLVLDYIISPNDKYKVLSNTLYIDIEKSSDHYPVVGNIFL